MQKSKSLYQSLTSLQSLKERKVSNWESLLWQNSSPHVLIWLTTLFWDVSSSSHRLLLVTEVISQELPPVQPQNLIRDLVLGPREVPFSSWEFKKSGNYGLNAPKLSKIWNIPRSGKRQILIFRISEEKWVHLKTAFIYGRRRTWWLKA